MDLQIIAKTIEVSGMDYKAIIVDLNSILNTKEVAKHIEPDTYIEGYGERELKDYIKQHYDWFD